MSLCASLPGTGGYKCRDWAKCSSSQYLVGNSTIAAGKCIAHTTCNSLTEYLVGASAVAPGRCERCSNVVCPETCRGNTCFLTKYRTGECTAATGGYTCNSQPTCTQGQYLTGASDRKEGSCVDIPVCGAQQYLQDRTYMKRTRGYCTAGLMDWVTTLADCTKAAAGLNLYAPSSCVCKANYRKDKDCDTSCNNAACNYDDGDCDLKNKFVAPPRPTIIAQHVNESSTPGGNDANPYGCYYKAGDGNVWFNPGGNLQATTETLRVSLCVSAASTYTCVGVGQCQRDEYLSGQSQTAAGKCLPHTNCRADAEYLIGANSTADGTCQDCANVTCAETCRGNRCPITTYRDGACTAVTGGYTCNTQPTCPQGQYLSLGAGARQRGTCLQYPTCTTKQYLQPTFVVERQGVCSAENDWVTSLAGCTAAAEQLKLYATVLGTCPSACKSTWRGDGECDAKCNIAACEYDNGDCGSSLERTTLTATHFNFSGSSVTEQSRPYGCFFSVSDRSLWYNPGGDQAGSMLPSARYKSICQMPTSAMKCVDQPTCTSHEYLKVDAKRSQGACKLHTRCNGDTYLTGADDLNPGVCAECGNTQCDRCAGAHCNATKFQYRVGNCSASTRGYTCIDHPTCASNKQYLNGSSMYTAGVCLDQPVCPPGERLAGQSRTVKGVCSKCADGQYTSGDGSCTVCPPNQCAAGTYLTGVCAGFEDARACKACDSAACPDNANASQYRTGSCTGRYNDYRCVDRPVCSAGQYLQIGTGNQSMPRERIAERGTCTECANMSCAWMPGGYQYRIGSCSGEDNGYMCLDAPVCAENEYLDGLGPTSSGACVPITSTSTSTSTSSSMNSTKAALVTARTSAAGRLTERLSASATTGPVSGLSNEPNKTTASVKMSQTSAVTTTTTPPAADASDAGDDSKDGGISVATAAIGVGALIVLFVLGIGVYCCWCRRDEASVDLGFSLKNDANLTQVDNVMFSHPQHTDHLDGEMYEDMPPKNTAGGEDYEPMDAEGGESYAYMSTNGNVGVRKAAAGDEQDYEVVDNTVGKPGHGDAAENYGVVARHHTPAGADPEHYGPIRETKWMERPESVYVEPGVGLTKNEGGYADAEIHTHTGPEPRYDAATEDGAYDNVAADGEQLGSAGRDRANSSASSLGGFGVGRDRASSNASSLGGFGSDANAYENTEGAGAGSRPSKKHGYVNSSVVLENSYAEDGAENDADA